MSPAIAAGDSALVSLESFARPKLTASSRAHRPRLRPILDFFSHYAGVRTAAESPGAFAVLRDGLDTSDLQRFPEEQFGNASNGKNLERCYAVIASVNTTT